MYINQWIAYLTTIMVFNSVVSFAGNNLVHEKIQLPTCLANKISFAHTVLAENSAFKIIDINSDKLNSLALLADRINCGRFVNVSHKLNNTLAKNLLKPEVGYSNHITYEIKHKKAVQAALNIVVADNIWQTLIHLTAYYNRSATKDTGVETAQWLKTQFEDMAVEYGREDTNAFFVKTGRYKQPSLVTVIGKDINAPAVIIGAHMDTLDGYMPGAGDDGSGSASIMEAARVLLASKTTLKNPIYIIWYAAEERGLVGSQYVVKYFKDKAIPVKAVAQFDMTGYRVNTLDPTMWVFTDYTNKALNAYVAQLISTYIKVPVDYAQCGYGCSDHASWTEIGIPAAFPCESNFEQHNPYIHTSADTMSLLSLEHMTNFTKLAIAFGIELAS